MNFKLTKLENPGFCMTLVILLLSLWFQPLSLFILITLLKQLPFHQWIFWHTRGYAMSISTLIVVSV